MHEPAPRLRTPPGARIWRAAKLGAAGLACFVAGLMSAPSGDRVVVQVGPEPHREAPPPAATASAHVAPAVEATAIVDHDPPQIGQSIGVPRAGALYGGARLLPGEGYLLRNPSLTFGTVEMVGHLERAIGTARAAFPKLHPLLVGDLSAELGGMLLGHRSHQSGRDVDVGMLYRRRPGGFPQRFTDATAQNLHLRATLVLLQALAETVEQPGGVEWILLDYGVQKILREFAAQHEGIAPAQLDRLFQFPHGPTAPRGLVRHYPGHRNHMHVRFACPPADAFCASPAGPPEARPGAPLLDSAHGAQDAARVPWVGAASASPRSRPRPPQP